MSRYFTQVCVNNITYYLDGEIVLRGILRNFQKDWQKVTLPGLTIQSFHELLAPIELKVQLV